MAVYTKIEESVLKDALAQFDVGKLVSFEGIAEGVENTNYLVVTAKGKYILTLIEKRTKTEELPFYTGFMSWLRAEGIPCPDVVAARKGGAIFNVAGKSALLTTFLEGAWPREILPAHCLEVGRVLARMHIAGQSFSMKRHNSMGLPAWQSLVQACGAKPDALEQGLTAMLEEELAYLKKSWPKYLPHGAVHADLFPDNVFFKDAHLSGVIDFYFACWDTLAYDLMLTFNPWCFDADGHLSSLRARAFFEGYQEVRPLSAAEKKALPFFGRAAAMRIIATRLYDMLNPAEGAMVTPKDPMEHVRILRYHRKAAQDARLAADYGVEEPA
ncbi:MAG: homoserine kinase [Alphaproteobacteria bacterium]|nr:homoserine kinase [Alphaproteobacteria bacterium]